MRRYDADNIFAKILRGDIPAQKLHEDAHLLVLRDIHPAAPVHLLVLPKGDYVSFQDFSETASPEIIAHFFATVARLAREHGLIETGYRLIANHGADAGQTVPHFHMHLLGGKALGPLVEGYCADSA